MTDIDAYIQRLSEANPLREPVLRSVIQALQLPPSSHGLDVGCGIGLQELLLAEAVGKHGHVTGVDILPQFLEYGENLARQAGLSKQITFREGDMKRLPFADDSFDWVWSADCIGYPAGELLPLLKEIIRVVKPEGSIILLAWTSQQLLPGYPVLEARLNATCSSYLPFFHGKDPQHHFLWAAHWFQEAGLEDIQARTFVGDVKSPLTDSERTALTSLLEMLWAKPQAEGSSEDWKEYQRLCAPDSADFILNQPGYYAFFTYSLFRGSVRKE